MSLYVFYLNYILGYYFYYKRDYAKSIKYYSNAINYNKLHSRCNFKLGISYFKQQEWVMANYFIKRALKYKYVKKWTVQLKQSENHIKKNVVFRKVRIPNIIFKNKQLQALYNEGINYYRKYQWYQAIDILKKVMKCEKNYELTFFVSENLFNLKRYSECFRYLKELEEEDNLYKDSYIYYMLGFCCEFQGIDGNINNKNLSNYYYNKAIEYDNFLQSKIYGIGVFHDSKKYLDKAAKAYEERIYEVNISRNLGTKELSNLYNKTGMVFDRYNDWRKAAQYYIESIKLNYHQPNIHYRLGMVYERLNDYLKAAESYKEAIDRSNEHKPFWHYRLGYVLNKIENKNYVDYITNIHIAYQDPHGTDDKALRDKNFRRKAFYIHYYESEDIEDQMIFYESFHGASMSCNPFAIFLKIYNNPDFKYYKHVWVINNLDSVDDIFLSVKNIYFVKRNSDLYVKFLAKAKYLVNNVSFHNYFIKKDKQVYLNTWHGTPFKFLGKNIREGILSHSNVTRNFLHSDILIHPNIYTKNILTKKYDVTNYQNILNVVTGYPRLDLTLNPPKTLKDRYINLLKLSENNKIILYAPTWRGLHNKVKLDFEKQLGLLKKLSNLKVQVLFKGHHKVAKFIDGVKDCNITIVPEYIDTNILLSFVDILITDYSSIAFDFLITKRPIYFYIYDQEEYDLERGLYIKPTDLFKNCYFTANELCKDLKDNINNINNYDSLIKKFSYMDDGNATTRVIDLFFGFKKNTKFKNKPILLFYAGPLFENGIATSFLNLLSEIKYCYNIVLLLEPSKINNLNIFNKLPKNISLVGYDNDGCFTLEEKWISDNFDNMVFTKLTDNILMRINKRNFKRVFGDINIDVVINFEGYNIECSKLLSGASCKKIIYQHNDMYSEYIVRFNYLQKIFYLYKHYDNVISVSKNTMMLNKEKLEKEFKIKTDNFYYLDNIINGSKILQDSKYKISDFIYYDDKIYFINIGRLSIEKDQVKLIYAFSEVCKTRQDIILIILGQGPLEDELKSLIKKLKLTKRIFLLGQKQNPYPYLKKSHCFISSSNHEGQPMVLLESLVLNKSIIATDIVGNKSVLENRSGYLVENSVDGLVKGINNFLDGNIITSEFNYNEYNKCALSEFKKLIFKK